MQLLIQTFITRARTNDHFGGLANFRLSLGQRVELTPDPKPRFSE